MDTQKKKRRPNEKKRITKKKEGRLEGVIIMNFSYIARGTKPVLGDARMNMAQIRCRCGSFGSCARERNENSCKNVVPSSAATQGRCVGRANNVQGMSRWRIWAPPMASFSLLEPRMHPELPTSSSYASAWAAAATFLCAPPAIRFLDVDDDSVKQKTRIR